MLLLLLLAIQFITHTIMRGIWSLFIIPLFLSVFSACSPYKNYTQAHQKATESEIQSRQQISVTAFQAVNKLCKVLDQTLAVQARRKSAVMMTRRYPGSLGRTVTETFYFPRQKVGNSILLAGIAKSMILKEVYPIVKEMTSELTSKLQRPVTAEEVLYRIVDHTGLIAIIGGMYGLGVEGIRHAGTELNNLALSQGSSLGIKNAGNNTGHSSTTSTQSYDYSKTKKRNTTTGNLSAMGNAWAEGNLNSGFFNKDVP
ncbi:MAG: hypothetical protein D3904_03230 [Candidatus Electrothrix sp. EH2]|nr:hypothetical protein [Candidatus Electrothrix sp. EH2]